jgi:hypothetical protein
VRRVRCQRGMLRRRRTLCALLVAQSVRRHSVVLSLWGESLGVLTGFSTTAEVRERIRREGLTRPSWMDDA